MGPATKPSTQREKICATKSAKSRIVLNRRAAHFRFKATSDLGYDHVGARRFEDILSLWSQRSPVGIEIGQGRLAEHIEHIAGEEELPKNGARYIGPVESELYCGVAKAFNLSFHAQTLAKNQAFTNGSLHSFNSLIQFMLATCQFSECS